MVLELGDLSLPSVALSDDGRYVAAADDTDVRAWDAESGEEVLRKRVASMRVLSQKRGPEGPRRCSVVFSPDSRLLAVISKGMQRPYTPPALCSVRVWEVESREEVFAKPDRKRLSGQVVRFSPDGRYLLAGTEDGGVVCWDLVTSKGGFPPASGEAPERRFMPSPPAPPSEAHDPVTSIEFQKDDTELWVGRAGAVQEVWSWPDGALLCYDFAPPAALRTLTQRGGWPFSAESVRTCLSAEGPFLVSFDRRVAESWGVVASQSLGVLTWRPRPCEDSADPGAEWSRVLSTPSPVTAIDASTQNIVATCFDGSVRCWIEPGYAPLVEPRLVCGGLSTMSALGLAVSDDFVAACIGDELFLYPIAEPTDAVLEAPPSGTKTRAASHCAVGPRMYDRVYGGVHDPRRGELVVTHSRFNRERRVPSPSEPAYSLCSPSGRYLALAYNLRRDAGVMRSLVDEGASRVVVWDLDALSTVAEVTGSEGVVTERSPGLLPLCFDDSEQTFAASAGARGVVFLRLADGETISVAPGVPRWGALSRSGAFALISGDGGCGVWNVGAGTWVQEWRGREGSAVAFDGQDEHALVALDSDQLVLADLARRQAATLLTPGTGSGSLFFSADGRRAYVSGAAGVAVFAVDDEVRSPIVVAPWEVSFVGEKTPARIDELVDRWKRDPAPSAVSVGRNSVGNPWDER